MQQTANALALARARLREPSSWAGIALLLAQVPAAWVSRDWQSIGAAVAGLLAVLVPEKRD